MNKFSSGTTLSMKAAHQLALDSGDGTASC